MISSGKLGFIFYFSLTICNISAGDFVLFDERIDSQQKPEIRYDVPADYVVSFEYFDKGDWKIYFNYDSNYPSAQKREYHPVEPLQLTNTGTWKNGSFVLTNCRFASSQNNNADMRFVSGKGACIRHIRLERK